MQGSGLVPVMWNILFTPVFDATNSSGICFADDLNLMSVCRMELDANKASTMASCAAVRTTMGPKKEVLTTSYLPKHTDKVDTQPTVRLVDIQVDPDANMKDHIAKVLSNSRIAKTRLVGMRPYCSEQQLLLITRP